MQGQHAIEIYISHSNRAVDSYDSRSNANNPRRIIPNEEYVFLNDSIDMIWYFLGSKIRYMNSSLWKIFSVVSTNILDIALNMNFTYYSKIKSNPYKVEQRLTKQNVA